MECLLTSGSNWTLRKCWSDVRSSFPASLITKENVSDFVYKFESVTQIPTRVHEKIVNYIQEGKSDDELFEAILNRKYTKNSSSSDLRNSAEIPTHVYIWKRYCVLADTNDCRLFGDNKKYWILNRSKSREILQDFQASCQY